MTVYVNAIMYYKGSFEIQSINFPKYRFKVYDSNKAVSAVDDYNTSTRSLAAATLRNFLGTRNLGEILSERFKQSVVIAPHSMFRDSIAREMKFVLDAATEPWGVLVERVEVKDVRWLFTS